MKTLPTTICIFLATNICIAQSIADKSAGKKSVQTPSAMFNPFDGKALVFNEGQILENVRVATLGQTAFIVMPPMIVTHKGKTQPKRQIWIKMSTINRLMVFDDRETAAQLQQKLRSGLKSSSPRPGVEFLPHPETTQPPFDGKIVVVRWSQPNETLSSVAQSEGLRVHSFGRDDYIAISSSTAGVTHNTELVPISRVDSVEIFDNRDAAELANKDLKRDREALEKWAKEAAVPPNKQD